MFRSLSQSSSMEPIATTGDSIRVCRRTSTSPTSPPIARHRSRQEVQEPGGGSLDVISDRDKHEHQRQLDVLESVTRGVGDPPDALFESVEAKAGQIIDHGP